jgi:hypothetical protein
MYYGQKTMNYKHGPSWDRTSDQGVMSSLL